jgi:cell shape-determining protein MreC
MKRISLNKVMAKLAEEQTPEQVQLGAIDDLKKRFDLVLMNFDALVSQVRNTANGFVDMEDRFDKISNEASAIEKQLADLGVDDSKLRSIAAESERLKNLSRQYIKTLR